MSFVPICYWLVAASTTKSFSFQVLFNQFSNFMDMFFLLMACSQFIPFLRIGLIYTYWGPLAFVTFVTMCREGVDDFRRFQRDREVNSSRYSKLTLRGKVSVSSEDLKVSRNITLRYLLDGGRHSTEVAFALHTQLALVRFLAFPKFY